MKVFILTTHRLGNDIFGSTCVFDSLRIGFPSAKVFVFDNNSDCQNQLIRKLAHENDCIFTPFYRRFNHHEFIENVVRDRSLDEEPIIFLDPDVIFYEEFESFFSKTTSLISGRLTPQYFNTVVNAIEVPRFHTSLLLINNPKKLSEKIDEVFSQSNFPFNAFNPCILKLNNQSYFYDTCANLFHLIEKDNRRAFPDYILDNYTHLVSGSMLDLVAPKLKNGERLKLMHQVAKRDPDAVRGVWKEHDKFYKLYSV